MCIEIIAKWEKEVESVKITTNIMRSLTFEIQRLQKNEKNLGGKITMSNHRGKSINDAF